MATSIINYPAHGGVDWHNATQSSDMLTALDTASSISAFIDMLRPGVPHVVSVSVTPYSFSSSAGFLIVDDKPYPLTRNSKTTAADSYTPTGAPLRVELVNVSSARVSILVDAFEDIGERVEPWQTLACEVFAPLPSDAFTWDYSRWGRAILDVRPPAPNTLYWDKGAFDVNDWYTEQNSSAWQDILAPATRLSVSRSVNALGPCLTAQAGMLTIEALNGLDPRALGVAIGAPVRLYDWQTREPLFTGILSEAATSRLKSGDKIATWHVVDKVAYLAATQRYGAIPSGGRPEDFDARINRLMKSDETTGRFTPTRYKIKGDAASRATLYGPTVLETSLAKHLDAAITTAGGYWYCRRDNWPVFSADAPCLGNPVLTLSDSYDAPSAWYYTSAASDWNTSALVTSIEVTNHGASLDDKGEWHANDETATVNSAAWSANYGGASAKADMTAPRVEDAKARALTLLKAINRYPALTAASMPITTRPQQLTALSLDPVDAVKTFNDQEEGAALITAVKHEITPKSWRVSLNLQPQVLTS